MGIGFLMQHEIFNLLTVHIEAHLIEQPLAQAGALDGFQELFGDNHVRIDILQRQGRRDAGKGGEFLHNSSFSFSLFLVHFKRQA